MHRSGSLLAACAAVAVLVAACTAAPAPDTAAPAPDTGTPDTGSDDVPAVTADREVTQPTVWLCLPDRADDPCHDDLDATVVAPDGTRTGSSATAAEDPPVDCFYVYPTVSGAETRNAPREVAPELTAVARAQAARFSQVCRVFAPVYRQVTLLGLAAGGFTDDAARDLAHGDVVSAWHDYLATYGGDRPFVLLGHSQGTFELTRLLAERIEPDPELRARLVSALLLGGDVQVPVGEDVGATFATVPACRASDQLGCVVAYNSFPAPPGRLAPFGRGGGGREVLCVNPAAPGGGPAELTAYLPGTALPDVTTPFVTAPGAITGECRTDGATSWLQIDLDGVLADAAPRLSNGLVSTWGLHTSDVSLALGDLVELVRTQTDALR